MSELRLARQATSLASGLRVAAAAGVLFLAGAAAAQPASDGAKVLLDELAARGITACQADDEAPVASRQPAEAAALAMVDAFVRGDTAGLEAAFTKQTRDAGFPAQLMQFRVVLVGLGEVKDLRSGATYVLTTGGGPTFTRTPCGPTRSFPAGASVAAAPSRHHAWVEVLGDGVNNRVAVTVLVVEEDGVWKAASAHLGQAVIAGRSAHDLAALARREMAAGHLFNTALLYPLARDHFDRGAGVVPNALQALNAEFAAFEPPAELVGDFPLRWSLAGRPETISHVGVMGLEAGIWVYVRRTAAGEWPSDAAIDAENLRFIESLVRRWPEIPEAFAGVIVHAVHPDGGQTYGTVWRAGEAFTARSNAKPS